MPDGLAPKDLAPDVSVPGRFGYGHFGAEKNLDRNDMRARGMAEQVIVYFLILPLSTRGLHCCLKSLQGIIGHKRESNGMHGKESSENIQFLAN